MITLNINMVTTQEHCWQALIIKCMKLKLKINIKILVTIKDCLTLVIIKLCQNIMIIQVN